MSEGFELFESPSALAALLDRDGKILRASASLERRAPGAKGKAFTELLSARDRARVEQDISRLQAGGDIAFHGALAGDPAAHHFSASRAVDGCVHLVGVPAPQDIAARIAMLDNVINSAPFILFELDKNGVYKTCEGKGITSMGIDPASFVGQNCLELMTGTDVVPNVRRALAGETFGVQLDIPNPVPPHEPLHYDAWYMPTRDDRGEITGMIGFSCEANEQRKNEKALREQLEIIEKQNQTLNVFSRVLDSAPMILWSIDREGKSSGSRGKGLELLGMPADLEMNVFDLYKDQPEILEPIIRALAGEESRNVTQPTPSLYFETWIMPIRHGDDVTGVMGFSIDATDRMKNESELREKLQLIERQSATIRALATPIIQVWDEVLCLPVIGTVDSARTAEMMQALLESIVREQARYAIVDLTGVEVVDTSTADHLIQLFRAARVLGVEGILCGIRPAVAQTVVALGLELGSVKTMRSLRDALKWCIRARAEERTTTAARRGSPASGSPGAL